MTRLFLVLVAANDGAGEYEPVRIFKTEDAAKTFIAADDNLWPGPYTYKVQALPYSDI